MSGRLIDDSDDLISRKALIKSMEKKYKIAEAKKMYPTGLSETFIITEQIIKEQPTAYDVDKVVEELEECAKEHDKIMCGCANIDERHCHSRIADTYRQSALIVKVGGKDE